MKLSAFKAATISVAMAIATPISAQNLELVIQSSEPIDSPLFAYWIEWADSVSGLTNGEVSVKLMPVDSVVGRLETLFAVRDGELDGHMTSTAYFAAEDPAFGLIGDTVGAWSGPEEMQKFINEGGGREVMQEILDPYNIQFVGAVTPGLEAFVSRVPLSGIDDLKGLNMRAPEGMVTAVFKELGALPENMGLEVVVSRLADESLDIADYSVFSNNWASGLIDVAKHPVYPGFHSMPLIEVSINKDVWAQISPGAQRILEESVIDLAFVFAEGIRQKDAIAIEEARNDPSVTIHDWSSEERNRFRVVALEKWNAVTYESDLSIKVYEAVTTFLWEEGRFE